MVHGFRIKIRLGQKDDSGERLAGFIDTLVDKLLFTVITVTDELNAFKVFETLNARGVRLSSTDLLKNYLFSIIHSGDFHESELRALEERWERIVGLLGNESFPEFLRVFWNSRNKLVRKSDLFKTIKRRINSRELAFDLIRGLDQSAEVYAALRDPSDKRWSPREREALQQLLMFNVRQPLSMLLAAYHQFAENERNVFTRILISVSVISFRYNVICNLQTHDQERIYNDIAWKVSKQEYATLADVLSSLAEIYPDDNTFKAAFSDKELRTTNTRNKKVVKYILFEIESALYQHDLDFESAAYNIEHILPEHPDKSWRYIEESRQDRLVYRLGNVTPLETVPNRDIGNSAFSSKKVVYSQSTFHMTQKIAEHYSEWDEHSINSRQIQMAKAASQIWRIDFSQHQE